jgi:hypothetical protein
MIDDDVVAFELRGLGVGDRSVVRPRRDSGKGSTTTRSTVTKRRLRLGGAYEGALLVSYAGSRHGRKIPDEAGIRVKMSRPDRRASEVAGHHARAGPHRGRF